VVSDTGRHSVSGRELELFQYWSTACQSNWALLQDWTQCTQYNNNPCDWIQVWEDYSSQEDSRSWYERNPGVGAYGNILYGGAYTPCTNAATDVQDYLNGGELWSQISDCVGAGG